MREYPIYEENAFNSSSGTACYDTVRLAEQEYEIEKRYKRVLSGFEPPFFTMGDLEWVRQDREVKFVPNPFGHWKIIQMPDERWMNKNTVDDYNFLRVAKDSPYLLTGDPTAYREQVAQGSKGGICIGSCIDAGLPNMGGQFCARLNHRFSHPSQYLEEFRKGIVFYSAMAMPENNREWVAMDLIAGKDNESNNRLSYGKCLFVYENGKFRIWRYGDKIAGFSSQDKSIDAYVRATANYLAVPKDGGFDYLKTVWDDEVIKQWKNFDRLNTTKYDLGVTASMLCMLMKEFTRIVTQNDDAFSDSRIIKAWLNIKDRKQEYDQAYRHNNRIAV